ncbi:unannotated protein [freshwater metagenome]|uniref:Unannotated protein n=1 Tax=freshwater metagenome TaxID=449393 RepID=A0A6J6DZS2_9ZZZZ
MDNSLKNRELVGGNYLVPHRLIFLLVKLWAIVKTPYPLSQGYPQVSYGLL